MHKYRASMTLLMVMRRQETGIGGVGRTKVSSRAHSHDASLRRELRAGGEGFIDGLCGDSTILEPVFMAWLLAMLLLGQYGEFRQAYDKVRRVEQLFCVRPSRVFARTGHKAFATLSLI